MFIMPFFLGLLIFILCTFSVYILLTKLGVLHRTTFKHEDMRNPYNRVTVDQESAGYRSARPGSTEQENDPEWDDAQDAEIITLPETALRKSEDADSTDQNTSNGG